MISDAEIITKINELKIKMGELWDERRETDHEILGLSIKIDNLLNQYYRLKLGSKN
jgi:hypothetical protein